MKYTHEIVGTHGGALLPERTPGACSGSKTPRVYRPLMIEWHRTKSLSKGKMIDIMMVFKTKGLQIRCIPHGSLGLSCNVNQAAKGHEVTGKNLSKGKNNF